jgi:hypothetical protein
MLRFPLRFVTLHNFTSWEFQVMDRRKRMIEQVEAAVTARDTTAMARAANGLAPLKIKVCLGPGRCMIPGSANRPVQCPFCVELAHNPDDHRHVEAIAHRLMAGN